MNGPNQTYCMHHFKLEIGRHSLTKWPFHRRVLSNYTLNFGMKRLSFRNFSGNFASFLDRLSLSHRKGNAPPVYALARVESVDA